MFEKNLEFTGLIEAIGSNGEGIVHIGETVYFAPFTVEGEKVKLKALKVKNKIGYAKALEILTPADERVRPRCKNFTKCGGCQLQHLRYGAQLKLKSKTVRDTLRKIAGIEWDVPLTVKSDCQFEYRNKLQIPVGVDRGGNTVIGFFAERTHRIVPVSSCPIHPDWAKDIIAVFQTYLHDYAVPGYDEVRKTGVLRHIVVRETDGNFLVTAVTATRALPFEQELAALLYKKFKSFSLWHNVNIGDGNAVLGDTFRLVCGDGRYYAHECGVRYCVGPSTFVQVNRSVSRKLYERAARAFAESGADVVIDAYSGCGILTAMLARQAEKAYGIEIVRESVACADEVVALNRLEGKMENICGKVESELPVVLKKTAGKKTFLVLDPPRKGVERSVLRAVLASGIETVVMISCNPSTMARDVGILTGALREEGGELKKSGSTGGPEFYDLVSVQPFDMFPQTKHVETLVLLSKKSPTVIS